MEPLDIKAFQNRVSDIRNRAWYHPLEKIIGGENLLTGFPDLLAYGWDRWPYANLQYRFGKFPFVPPLAVAIPGSYEEVAGILKLANQHKLVVIPYGLGSGVLGGAIPLGEAITVDMKRLNGLLDIDEISYLATVQAGMNGEIFEAALNRRHLTMGHFPQSLYISSVGGWLSCRSAGQASSRYGKIEDMVVGLKAVLPTGDFVDVRPAPRRAVGPSVKDILVGAEGTLGIIVEATLRILPYPERETVHVIGFPNYAAGLEALRRIMQAELRPAITRLYDENEAKSRIAAYPEYAQNPCIAMLTFNGLKELVEVEERLSLKICKDLGGVQGSPEPAYTWMQHRFESLSAKPIFEGKMMDTIEIAAPWRALPGIYEGMKAACLAVNKDVHFGAHWSHTYTDGACMYVTFILPAPDPVRVATEHKQIWEGCMRACLLVGGSVSHHHGVGYFRGPWMAEELGQGHKMLQGLKDFVDPNHIMNPGKLGLK